MDPTLETQKPTDEAGDAGLPPLPRRLLQVFVSPGVLADRLAVTPRWLSALVVSAVLVGLSTALIPVDVFLDAQRAAAIERGASMPDMPEQAVAAMRVAIPVFGMLSIFVFALLFAGLYTLVFAFVLGDEGRFKQYLAVLAHSWFIAALFSLLLTPLKIRTGDPQFTLNLASFVFFLPDGYIVDVFRALDITQIWSTLVFAQGVHAIDRRRGFGSAAVICLIFLLAFAMVAANFI